MASHTRELLHLLGECLGDADFDSTTSISRAQEVKNKFIARDFPVGAEAATNNHNSELDLIHTYDALVTVCNEVIELSGKHAGRVDFIEDDGEARLAWKFIALSVERDPARMEKVVDAALAHKAVDFLYCAARPRQFDMFVHLSAAEMFFIDGDSLLMAALSSQHVDWDLIQPLHVFHNAQALLHRLHSRGARFHVVFFDQATWFWEKAPAKLLLRENLRLALTNVARDHPATELVVKTFPSFHDATFAAYVAEYDPEFILMSDGEQLGALNEMQLLFTNKVMDEKRRVGAYRSLVDDEAHGAKVSFYLRCFLAWCIAHSVKVAYSSRILSKENAIVVFAVAAEGLQQTRATKMESATVELAAALEHEVQLPSVSEEAIAASKDSGLSFREQIITGALHAFLAAKTRTPAELQLVQALAVTAYSASMVDASLRAQLAMRSPAIAAFLTDLAPFVLQILHERGCAKARGAEFDILDGHLLAAMVHHLRTNPLSALLDEQGVGDVNYSWQQLIKDDAATVGATPLDLLPEVVFDERRAPVKCPHFTHELVDALAAKFGVEGHVSDRAFPASLGCADLLSGWKITEPFDEMNDVVDAYVVEESQRNMKDTERRRLARLETAFVADAAQQATSMGLNGFTAGQLALVCSDDDEPDAAAEKGAKAKQHAGQKNKKVRRNKDSIKESANIRDADHNLRKRIDQMEVVLKATDLQMDRTNNDDRKQAMDYLDASIKDMQQKRFGEKFDPGEDIGDANKTLPLKTAMWRVLVEASGMTEAVFAVHLEEGGAKRGAKKSISAPEDGVFALSVIKGLTANLSDASGSDWGPLQRLHLAKPDMMADEAVFYLFWVYLSQVQAHLTARLRCRVVKLLLDNWKVERTRARNRGETPDIHVGIPLFIYCHHQVLPIIRDRGILFSGEDLDIVRSALYHFEFDKMYYAKVDRAIAQWQQKEITSAPSNRPLEKLLEQSPELIQLMHMGHLLERPIIPHKDYRVVFNPDGWQRELLDIVDQRGSAVVCAPTSAGKTFISYYCMYNALKTSNTKVVVYVAPNRALINQAVADVCARYGKKEYVVAGKNVYGVHGGADYHRFHDTCQILVTLPEVLETLLLSPKYESWVERLDYVILDEIHTMESSGNGDVWERVLSLLPCPFVALSATLGETSQLCGWLNRVQSRLQGQIEASKTKQRRRDFVVHEIPRDEPIQRWNDIKKYIYLPPPGFHHPLRKLTAKYEPRNIKDLHPLSILTLDQLRRGFPPDISLVPSEVVQLHEKMVEQFTQHIWIPDWQSLELIADLKAQLDELMPETYFSKVNYITQRHARQYESEVKNAFSYWAYLSGGGDTDDAERPPEAFFEAMLVVCDAILKAFSQHLRAEEESLEKYASDSALLPVEQRVGNTHPPQSKDFIASSIIDVLRELVSRDMAPTIVFSFESEDCDNLVEAIVTQLERAEDAYRQTEEFARYRVGVERKAAAKEAARKQRESTLAQKKLEKNEDGDVVRAERDVDVDGGDDDEECVVPEVLPEFTFIRYMNSGAGAAAVKECEKRGDYLAARAIKRGVGIHHAGVKGKLRRTFEVLFRSGHCGVILATETLALGVHSPCRSVVLAGDHVLLNTTQFRQMMGRAGRRGLDTLGHLIFLSVGMKKITRLMTSSMTVIKGNVQMDPISQLRLLQLHDHREHRGAKKVEEWKARVVSLAERLFVNPLFFEGRARVEGGNMEPFSIEYFQMLLGYFHKEGLHFKDRPSSLGSLLVDVMSVFRNARVGNEGFSFISMLTRKIFASAAFGEVVENFTSSETSAAVELMAYLFSVHQMCGVPLEIHRSVLSDPAVQALWKLNGRQTKQHRVVLAPLHGCVPDGVQVIDNANMFRAISGFYSELARKLKEPASTVLPYMTKKKYPLFGEAPSEDFPLCGKLRETAVAYDARDPFVAISGCGDNFVNSDDLVSTLRSGLFCDRRLLPTLDLSDGCRHDGAQVLINACIADFIRCGSQMQESNYRFTYLEKYNGLTQSESFSVLNQVERLLSNIGGLVRDGQKDQMKTLTDMDVLTKLLPEEDVEKYDAGASKILEICATLHGLREQIDKDYSAVLLRMKQAESRKKKAAAS